MRIESNKLSIPFIEHLLALYLICKEKRLLLANQMFVNQTLKTDFHGDSKNIKYHSKINYRIPPVFMLLLV